MYYRIDWCISKNALGGTRTHTEQRMEDVILWLVSNVEALEKRTAGFTVYECHDDERPDALPETVYNWQERSYSGSYTNFGYLHADHFPISVVMSGNHSVICHDRRGPDVASIPFSLDSFAACFSPAELQTKEV